MFSALNLFILQRTTTIVHLHNSLQAFSLCSSVVLSASKTHLRLPTKIRFPVFEIGIVGDKTLIPARNIAQITAEANHIKYARRAQ